MHAAEVHLDHQIEVANVVVAGHRRVRPRNILAVDGGREEDMPAGRKAEDVLRRLQSKAEPARVVADDLPPRP